MPCAFCLSALIYSTSMLTFLDISAGPVVQTPPVRLIETLCHSTGLPVEAAQQGYVQSSANQLFSPNHSSSDTEHHHVQAGQEAQRSVWPPAGKEDGVIL